MGPLVLVRWVALRWACEPWKWAAFLCLVSLWPALHAFAPFGEDPDLRGTAPGLYEIAFVAAGVGAACALDALEVQPAMAAKLGLRAGWSAEWTALAAGAAAVQAAALAVPVLAHRTAPTGLDLALCANVCLNSAWLAAVGVALLRVPMPSGARPVALLVATWIVPALVPSPEWSSVLGAGFVSHLGDSASRSLAANRIASISALLLGVHLMDARRWRRS
jgi:hypothetical protein